MTGRMGPYEETCGMIAFEISIRARPDVAEAGPDLVDPHGVWPTLVPSPEAPPLPVDGDACLQRLGSLPRMFTEPDGSFVWVGLQQELDWQVDGQVHERDGRVVSVDLMGRCPEREFDRLMMAFGWPGQPLMMEMRRAGVFLDESAFRRHAADVFQSLQPRR